MVIGWAVSQREVDDEHVIHSNQTHTTTMKNQTTTLFSTSTLALCAALLFASHGMAASKDTLDSADVKFVKRESAAGMAEVKIANLGAQKAGRADVKAFATTLITDHTQVNSDLKALAEKKGVEVSAVISPKSAEEFQKLEKVSGPEFDKEFLAEIVSGHKKCVSSFEEASKDAKDSDVKSFADKVLPTLKAHLALAEELAAK